MQNNFYDKAIISDTSCLIALTDINKLDVLRLLFKEIIITPEVAAEYRHPLPEWIVVKDAENKDAFAEIRKSQLGIGESSSIALAMETQNATLILDDDRARNYALKKGLAITGTLTVIGEACDLGYIESYESVCEDLRKVNFRFSRKLQEEVKNITMGNNSSQNTGNEIKPKRGFHR